MNRTQQLIEHTESMLRNVDMLLQVLDQSKADLKAQAVALREELAQLKKVPHSPRFVKYGHLASEESASSSPEPATLKSMHGDERRATLRRKGNPVPIDFLTHHDMGEPLSGWVMDRSLGGLSLLTDEEIPEGTFLSIRPTNAPSSFLWIECQVRNCKRERNSWRIGLQFMQEVTWEELRLFG